MAKVCKDFNLDNHVFNGNMFIYDNESGIKGAHKMEGFEKCYKHFWKKGDELAKSKNKKLLTPMSINLKPKKAGVFVAEYMLPHVDDEANRNKIHKKTIYTPAFANDDIYIKRGLQAAIDAEKNKYGEDWIGKDKQGVWWKGYAYYLGSNKYITTCFPY